MIKTIKKPRKIKFPVPSDLKGLQDLLGVVSRGKKVWESTFDAIRDPVMIIDKGFRIIRANIAAAERSERDVKKIVGHKCYEVFAKRESACPHCPLAGTLETHKPSTVDIPNLMPQGDFQVNSYPVSPEVLSGHQGAVHHYRDITEERRLQKQLTQNEKMAAIGMLAGGVAHEINNPLAGILAFTQILRSDLPAGSQSQEDLGEIEEAAKRCKRIVEDLLVFAQPYREGDMSPLSLPPFIEKILPLAHLGLKNDKATLNIHYDDDLPEILGNGGRLQQVFLNLVKNAAQSMLPDGGEVSFTLRASPDHQQVVMEVQDHGCGIKEENLPKIFDPFFSTKFKIGGTGLGLSICYSIVTEHGGRIEVKSVEGKGTLFRVILPAVSRPED